MTTQNGRPMTSQEVKNVMTIRHTVPKTKQLCTSGGVKVYMMAHNFKNRAKW